MTWLFYWLLFDVFLRYPYIVVTLVLLYYFRDRIPSPTAYFQRQKAFTRLKQEVAINPHDSTARRNLGFILLEKNRPKEALDNFLDALKKDDSAEINHFAGVAYLRSGMPDKAVEHLKKAIAMDPRFRLGESYQWLGDAYNTLGRHEEALDTLKSCLSLNTTSIEGKYQYARALKGLGKKDEAKKAAEEGITFHRHNPRFLRRRDWRSYVRLKSLKRGL